MNADDDWFDAVAGREQRGSRAAREGGRLRHALSARVRESDDDEPASSRAREERLIAHARASGLLTAKPARSWRPALAIAASVLLAGVSALWWRASQEPDFVVRGTSAGLTTLAVQDPAAAQSALIADLRRLHIAAQGYEMLGRYGVDADLPFPPDDALRAVLARYELGPPPSGVLRVEFVSSATR